MGMFKQGDLVSIEAKVMYDQRETDWVLLDVSGTTVRFDPADVSLTRPFFKAGDTGYVSSATGDATYKTVEVIGTHDFLVWVKKDDGGTEVVEAIDVLREIPGTVNLGSEL